VSGNSRFGERDRSREGIIPCGGDGQGNTGRRVGAVIGPEEDAAEAARGRCPSSRLAVSNERPTSGSWAKEVRLDMASLSGSDMETIRGLDAGGSGTSPSSSRTGSSSRRRSSTSASACRRGNESSGSEGRISPAPGPWAWRRGPASPEGAQPPQRQ